MNASNSRWFIRWSADIAIAEVPLVDGEAAFSGERARNLAGRGVRDPNSPAIEAGIDARDLVDTGWRGRAATRQGAQDHARDFGKWADTAMRT